MDLHSLEQEVQMPLMVEDEGTITTGKGLGNDSEDRNMTFEKFKLEAENAFLDPNEAKIIENADSFTSQGDCPQMQEDGHKATESYTTQIENGTENGSRVSVEAEEAALIPDEKFADIEVIGYNNCGKNENSSEKGDEFEFLAGDLVWAKLKSCTWWPGKVIEPKQAPKQEGICQVMLYGELAKEMEWCNKSELKPFVENFATMATKSDSKAFDGAVNAVLNEFGRMIEMDMACSCFATEDQRVRQSDRDVIKRVLGPFCVSKFDPVSLLIDLRLLAWMRTVGNKLEVKALESRVAAFRRKYGAMVCKNLELEEGESGSVAGLRESVRGPVQEGKVGKKRKMRSLVDIYKSLDMKEKLDNKGNTIGEPGLNPRSRRNEQRRRGKRSASSATRVVEHDQVNRSRTRDKKLSKYLCPPYINLDLVKFNASPHKHSTRQASMVNVKNDVAADALPTPAPSKDPIFRKKIVSLINEIKSEDERQEVDESPNTLKEFLAEIVRNRRKVSDAGGASTSRGENDMNPTKV